MLPVEAAALQAGEDGDGLLPANVSPFSASQCLERLQRLQATQPMVSLLRYLVSEAHRRAGGHVLYQFVVALQDGRGYSGSPGMPGHPGSPGVKGEQVSERVCPPLCLVLCAVHTI